MNNMFEQDDLWRNRAQYHLFYCNLTFHYVNSCYQESHHLRSEIISKNTLFLIQKGPFFFLLMPSFLLRQRMLDEFSKNGFIGLDLENFPPYCAILFYGMTTYYSTSSVILQWLNRAFSKCPNTVHKQNHIHSMLWQFSRNRFPHIVTSQGYFLII